MTVTTPFSQSLRERTRSGHADSEGAGFMSDLMSGKGSRDDYVALVAQHFFIYRALEAAAESMTNDPVASAFISPELTRLPAIARDLRFLIGDDWRDRIAPLQATTDYVRRIDEVASTWAGGFIAHHYTRYLGDLSGGQVIAVLIRRQFGFETDGVGFYLFGDIPKPREFKEAYRRRLDAVVWDDRERDRVIEEVLVAYRCNTELFRELGAARAGAEGTAKIA